MRGRHRKRTRLFRSGRGIGIGARHDSSRLLPDLDVWRRLLGSTLVISLLVVSGTAFAADEATTTTTITTTTTTTLPSTTTTLPGTTTTTPSEDETPGEETTATTTTIPTTPGTTAPSVTPTTTITPTSTTMPTAPTPAPSEPPDPETEAAEFRVGHLRAPSIVFPLIGPHSFVDTFGAPRDGGRRRHAGIDIMARRGVPIVAVAAGVVEKVDRGTLAGQYVVVRHDDGWRSKYLHLDNDTPGTDDGLGFGYAKGIRVGMRVHAGTVLGFVGDSGNSEHTVPHLHFGLYQPNGLPINPYRALVAAPLAEPVYPTPVARTFNTELVGHLVPGGSGFNSDIAVSGDYVYVGSAGQGDICPGTGVRVIDVSDPARPKAVSAFAGGDDFPGTATSSVWVGKVATGGFDGVLAVVAVQLCDEDQTASVSGRFAGLAVYDVGDPTNPVLLSTVHSGDQTGGASHVDLIADGDRLLAAATVPQSYLDHPESLGDIRVYDLTRVFDIKEVANWDIRRDGPLLLVETLGAVVGDESLAGKSASWADPDHLVVAHSAAGLVTLDTSDANRPVYVGSTATKDAYRFLVGPRTRAVSNLDASQGGRLGDSLLVQNEHRLQPRLGPDGEPASWGRQRLFNLTDPANPRLVATIDSAERGVDGEVILDGIYSPRASVRLGDSFQLVTWLSGGVRVIDVKDPSEPREVAYFVPPSWPDPHGSWAAPDGTREFPLAWDVATDGGLVYLSDVNSGLWIFRVTIPVVERVNSTPE